MKYRIKGIREFSFHADVDDEVEADSEREALNEASLRADTAMAYDQSAEWLDLTVTPVLEKEEDEFAKSMWRMLDDGLNDKDILGNLPSETTGVRLVSLVRHLRDLLEGKWVDNFEGDLPDMLQTALDRGIPAPEIVERLGLGNKDGARFLIEMIRMVQDDLTQATG